MMTCPNCQAPAHEGALFCEACGYDFTTGAAPRGGTVTAEPAPAAEPVEASVVEAPAPMAEPVEAPVVEAPTPHNVEAPLPASSESVTWVAEVWVDPDWYAVQRAEERMPSPGLPDIIALPGPTALIGRESRSRGIHPEIDAHSDTSCSRRQAQLTTDGQRWFIEDLDSANGTYVGQAGGPLPEEPIGRGRVQLNDGDRIYVGAWTRIVVRKATPDERAALS